MEQTHQTNKQQTIIVYYKMYIWLFVLALVMGTNVGLILFDFFGGDEQRLHIRQWSMYILTNGFSTGRYPIMY